MTRIFACLVAVLTVIPLSACSTTTQRTVTGISVCVASVAADVALAVTGHWSVYTGGLVGLAGCEVGEAVLREPTADNAQLPKRDVGDESSQ